MESHLHALISFLSAHPHLGLSAVFGAALLEAVAVIGTFIPGSSVVFVGGVLVGLKVLDPSWTIAAAVIGAILGDGISYWLGRRYHDRIRTLGPLRRYPAIFDRGQAYFAQNGGWSVFAGRILGPLRAIVPVVAGMSDMPATRFYIVNVLSALAWVVAHLAPGVLFGASLQLAGAISSRLVVLVILVVGTGWLLSRLVRMIHGRLQPVIAGGRDRFVIWARTASSPQQRAVLALFDPQRPESAALLACAVVLVASVWLFFGVLEDVLSNDALVHFDRAVFAVLQSVRTGWADSLMVAVTEVGSAAVALPVIVAVALLLVLRRCWRTLAYWLATMGFAQVLVWVLKLSIGRERPSAIYSGIEQFSFPSGHAASSIALYGFLAFLLGRGQSARMKAGLSAAASSIIGLIAFSRIYLGAHWFSDVLASLSIGLAWVTLLGIACTHHARNERLPARWLAAVSLGTMTVAAGVYMGMRHEADVTRYAHRSEQREVPLANWSTLGWRTVPAARSDVGGDLEEPLALQWAATEQEISAVLVAAGWRAPSPWAPDTALLWLLPNPPIQQLPVLPKFHQGEVQSITLAKVVDDRQRLVLRLWPSGHVVDLTAATGSPKPLWLGAVTIERLQHPTGVFTIVATHPEFRSPLRLLEKELQGRGVSIENRDRQGFPALLAW